MTINEAKFVDIIANHKYKVETAQQYIKNHLNIETQYNEDTNTLYMWTTNINESKKLAEAKNFILSNFDNKMINIKFGKEKEDK